MESTRESNNAHFDSIESAIKDIAAGKPVIVTDDEARENEGDLILAAEKATTESINQMILHAMGLMTNRDFENYSSLFELMESFVKGPDLLIYLRSSIPNLVAQIHKRGRDYENTISIDYLSRLNERYEAWISKYSKGNLLIIDVDNLDFVSNPEDLGDIINKIDAEINGLF